MTGGLKGRVMKQIWSGTWSSGSITIPDLPYYNVFALSNTDNFSEYMIGFRANNQIHFYGMIGIDNTFWFNSGSLAINGTRLTVNNIRSFRIAGGAIYDWNSKTTIFKILGIL